MTDRYKEAIQGARDCVERNKDGGVFLPDLLRVIDSQEAEIEKLSRLVVKENDRKRIISEIFTRIKKCSFDDTRMKEGGGFERVSIVFRDDVNKCLQDFLRKWIGDTE